MKIPTLGTIIIVSFFFAGCSATKVHQGQILPSTNIISRSTLHSCLDDIVNDTLFAQCSIGLKIVSLENDSVLYDHNSTTLFHPASNMKLFTTATALHVLDKDFKFSTTFSVDTIVKKGILKGNIYVKGRGDPLLETGSLDIANLLREQFGIRIIKGNIVGDVSYFDSTAWGSGWMWDDEPDPDEAFITPLTINSNAIQVHVVPGSSPGKPLEVNLTPATHFLHVKNFGRTSHDTSLPPLKVTRLRSENTVTITGKLSPSDMPRSFTFSVRNPAMYFLNLLKERLIANNIAVKGTTRIDTAKGAKTLVELSHPLDSVIMRINKESDNLAAENLLKSMASEKLHTTGSASDGLLIVKSYLSGIGIDTSRIILADGSGVSWYNAVSPADIVRLLEKEFANKETFQRFLASLPVAGVDGTLKNQMIGTRAMGNVHAKTGTLTGVSSLSGYITTADNKLLAFSILANHFPGRTSLLRDMQNKIMEVLANDSLTAQ